MSKICPKCGQTIDDDAIKCPFCNSDLNVEENEANTSVEQPTVSVPEVTAQENAESAASASDANVSEEVSTEHKPQVLPVNETDNVNFNQQSSTASEANETSDTVISAGNVLEEISVSDNGTDINNLNIESVSVSTDEGLSEEEEKPVEVPTMPEPTIGEIAPDLLGNVYDQEEKINNEKIAEQMRRDEEERKRLETEKMNQPMEKPDLLASASKNDDVEGSGVKNKSGKHSGKHMMNILTAIIVIAALVFVVWYFFLREPDEAEKNSYMDPIVTYFNSYDAGNVENMLSAWVPCLAKNDEVISEITKRVNDRLAYKSFYLEYNEIRAEVVNGPDKEELNKFLSERCEVVPEVTDYKHVYINEKISDGEDKVIEEINPEFYTVLIDGKWYMMALQDK